MEFKTQKNKNISELLIDYIEPSGWLTSNLDELANFSGFQKTEIESVLLRMQTFEPNGVFARNLKECLIIQLKNDERLTDNKRKNIENLELLGEGNLKELQKITNLREEEVRESKKKQDETRIRNRKKKKQFVTATRTNSKTESNECFIIK